MSKFTAYFKDLTRHSTQTAGGKGAQLGEMYNSGIPVPLGFVVLTHSFNHFLQANTLGPKIKDALDKVDKDDTKSVDNTSQNIRTLIEESPVPVEIQDAITKAFNDLSVDYVAVRSSATAEDAANASWAGELESYTNVTKEDVVSMVQKCWASLFTPRAIFYRMEKNLPGNIAVAVVVQKMVNSETAGVCFTVNPVTKDLNQIVIEAGWGLGESVVAGIITPDNYLVNKSEDLIEDVTVNEQEQMIIRKSGKSEEVKVPQDKKEAQKLTGKQIMQLANLAKKIENHYCKPQDIEWAWDADTKQLYIVQTRPVTTL